jgi:hypothetical protein
MPRSLLLAAVATACLWAQAPQPSTVTMKPPLLKPGEGFAITMGDGEVHAYGAAKQEAPMGQLALLVWMRMEGTEWASRDARFNCTGKAGPFVCWNHAGHGKVNLGKALRENCNLAFLVWVYEAQVSWKADYGEAAARARMENVFAPFLGRRMPARDVLPPLTAAWVGDGDLLRTSPEAFLRWLMEPEQAQVLSFGRRFMAGFWSDVKDLIGKEGWWFKTATATVPGDPATTCAWVAGGRGEAIVVLYMPRGTAPEGLARLRELLGSKG